MVAVLLKVACLHADSKVNDITGLNPIEVARVVRPNSVKELAALIQATKGPISVAGGRYSMGGQTAFPGSLNIDMSGLNQVVAFNPSEKEITVQAGMTWRQIQEIIDPHNLAIRIMQTYANFTVGGSLSVNVHGRYIGEGPIVRSVESIKLILADGSEQVASRSENRDLFFGAIGGYSGLGVIAEATLKLVDNQKIELGVERVMIDDYQQYFLDRIRDDPKVVFHNGDIYPPAFEEVRAETWRVTDAPLTETERLRPPGKKYWVQPTAISAISSLPFGTELRESLLDPLRDAEEVVCWRNYEASYDVANLEPITPRLLWTYVLQEYFVPVNRFDDFVATMKKIFDRHKVNVINVSIRHALPDPGTMLAWAPEEVFSFVVYYKQRTTKRSAKKVEAWTRELISQALQLGGRYYLPYQVLASQQQFEKAYPRWREFYALKRKVDPTGKFQNILLNTYRLKQ
jgi:FAD/FMN-containing dehydrogenase